MKNWKIMKKNLKLNKIALASLIYISRLNLLPANFSTLGSFGFFGQSPILYFGIIILFDLLVGGFYQGFTWVYLGFACYLILGRIAQKNLTKQIILLPLASFLFFLISNFGVWLNWYPRTLAGFQLCYTLALPFYTKTLLGDLVFGYGFLLGKYLFKKFKCNKIRLAAI